MKLSTNMRISTKLIGGFIIVAMICAMVGGVGWMGLNATQKSIAAVADERLPAVQGLGMMMEAMSAIKSVERTMVNSTLTGDQRRQEIDNLSGEWEEFEKGKSIYQQVHKSAEEETVWSQLQPVFETWKGEHQKLVDNVSVIQLDNVGSLEAILIARQLDHIKWAGGLDVAIADNQEFQGGLDPTKCGLGKWLGVFQSGDANFDDLLKKFNTPHQKLHELGSKINELIFMNNFTSTEESPEARALFESDVEPTLKKILSAFDETLAYVRADMGRLDTALNIAFGSEHEAINASMTLLNQLGQMSSTLAEEVRVSAQESAMKSKTTSAGAVLLGVALAAAFGIFLSRNITNSLRNAINVIQKIGLGDTSESLPAGEPVNCSSKKKCGNESCPSYGKVDTCWTSSGSFAAVKHCPRAQKGEDCRTCELYSAKTELEELGAIINGLSNGLEERENLALAIAKGDLTKEVEIASENDGLGRALQDMTQNLKSIIGEVKVAGEQIAAGASQVSDSSQSLSQGATESAASIEEITASMHEMASQTKLNAENAAQANQLSDTAKSAAEGGNQHMQGMIQAMGEISDSSQNISKIIKVIDEIAFQTNLLALNAAVEAARAGKHGKGFAVVAEEVRNLAARSAKAARETADLIEGSVAKTQNGAEIANRTAESLGEIVDGVTKVSDLVAEIAAASNEQAEGIGQVNQGLSQIDSVTQQNTANAEQSAAASEELSSQAAQMKKMLAGFILDGQNRFQSVQPNETHPQSEQNHQPSQSQQVSESPANQEFAQAPEEMIALDDSEFGKY